MQNHGYRRQEAHVEAWMIKGQTAADWVKEKTSKPAASKECEHWGWESHYQTMQIQPFEVMEMRSLNHSGIPRNALDNIVYALKYLLRAGFKQGQPWRKEVTKSLNHLYRALTGEWMPQQLIDEISKKDKHAEK